MHVSLRATVALLLVGVLSISAPPVNAQQGAVVPSGGPSGIPSGSGREFWLVFQKNFRDVVINERTQTEEPAAELNLEVFIASSVAAEGYVEIPALGFRHDFRVAPGATRNVRIPNAAQVTGSGVVEKLAVHIVSDQPITVYGLNRRYQTTDTYLAIPVDALGTSYRAVGYRWLQNDLLSQMAVIATEDNTVVTINPGKTRIARHVPTVETPSWLTSYGSPAQQDLAAMRESAAAKRLQAEEPIPLPFDVQSVEQLPTFSYAELKRTIVVPSIATRRGDTEAKTVIADVKVRANGTVEDVVITKSEPQFDEHVTTALRKLKYKAGRKGGKAVTAWVRVPVDVSPQNFGGEPAVKSEVRVKVEMAIAEEPSTYAPEDFYLPIGHDTLVKRAMQEQGWIPDADRTSMVPGEPITVTLNRGEVFQIIPQYNPNTASDLTGTLVTSTKPVAVFSGHNCAYVPDMTVKACNLLAEQMPPTTTWGHTFAVGGLESRSRSVVRVIAREDSTTVTLDGKPVANLSAGEHYENPNLVGNALIIGSRPILVAQFSMGFDNGDGVGDPMMIIVPPIEQYDNVYTITTPVRGSWHHFLNVVVRTDAIADLHIDTHPVDQTRFRRLGETEYSVGSLEIPYGSHTLAGAKPFGLYQYGFGYDESAYDGYGNSAGQLYIDLENLVRERAPDAETPDLGMLGR